MQKTRDPVFDIMKGIAMLLVVMSHSFFPEASNKAFVFFRSTLFFMISGYFAKEWLFCDLVKNGIKKIAIPLLFTNIIMLFIVFILDLIMQTNVVPTALKSVALGTSSWDLPGTNISQISAGPLWFLWALIWVRIYWVFLQKKNDIISGVTIIVFAVIAFHLKTYVTLPFSILSSFGALGFFFAGHMIRKYSLLENAVGRKIFPICLICLIYCIGFSNIDINFCHYGAFYIVDLSACVAGFFIIQKVVKTYYMQENRFWNFLHFIGRYSLVFLCAHSIDQCISVDWMPFKLWSFFETKSELVCAYLIKVLFATSLTFIVSKIKFLSEKIFFIK